MPSTVSLCSVSKSPPWLMGEVGHGDDYRRGM